MDGNVTNFSDLKAYNAEMLKSAYDKIGFVNEIFEPLDVIVDFGCADGGVTRMIKQYYPESLVIGYDLKEVLVKNGLHEVIDPIDVVLPNIKHEQLVEIIDKTLTNTVFYTSNLTVVDFLLEQYKVNKSLLVMNSVTHEIYNYMSKFERRDLFNALFKMDFDYIWVRDMKINACKCDPEDFHWIYYRDIISRKNYGDRLKSFIEWNGAITNYTDLVHFLMKCRYKNWGKECSEDYNAFGNNINEFENVLAIHGYYLRKSEDYALPYLEYINKEIVNFSRYNITTHTKRLYVKEEEV